MAKNKVGSVRLSKYIVPKKYSITLAPDLENFIFEGAEEIVLDIQRPTNKITLHAAELEILSVELVRGKKKW